MYELNSRLPAPYELNASAITPPVAAFAKGGRAKSRKMVIAHFNPKELDIMDHLQGGEERCPKTGLRSYSHLEDLLKNPHIVENVHKHTAKHRAMGGPVLNHLAEGGRFGDNEIALIGHNTHNLFDRLAGHRTQNPNTGHPEYFSLGNFLKGAWDTVKGVGSSLAPAAGMALGGMFGGPAGAALGGMAGNAASSMLSGGKAPNATASNIAGGLQGAYDAYKGGASPTQAFGQGLQKMGTGFGQGGVGSAFQGMGNALSQGKGWGSALRQGAEQGYQGMGGMEGLKSAAGSIMNRFGQQQQQMPMQQPHQRLPALPSPQYSRQETPISSYGNSSYGQEEYGSPYGGQSSYEPEYNYESAYAGY